MTSPNEMLDVAIVGGGIDFKLLQAKAICEGLDFLHKNPAEATPLQIRFDGNKPDNAEARTGNVQPRGPYRCAVAHEEQWMIARQTVVGMPFVIAIQTPILPENALANMMICRPIAIAFDALEMDRRRHVTFLRMSAGSAVPPAHP